MATTKQLQEERTRYSYTTNAKWQKNDRRVVSAERRRRDLGGDTVRKMRCLTTDETPCGRNEPTPLDGHDKPPNRNAEHQRRIRTLRKFNSNSSNNRHPGHAPALKIPQRYYGVKRRNTIPFKESRLSTPDDRPFNASEATAPHPKRTSPALLLKPI